MRGLFLFRCFVWDLNLRARCPRAPELALDPEHSPSARRSPKLGLPWSTRSRNSSSVDFL
eukprot:1089681-Pyramimonas_sp.AAC.1